MAVVSIKNKLRRGNLLVGNEAYDPGAFVSIASTTLSTSATTVTFSNIPATYQHLQIRSTFFLNSSGDNLTFTFNSDNGSNYAWHQLFGYNGTVTSNAGTSDVRLYSGYSASSSQPSCAIIDIHDYANNSKYKTTKIIAGSDNNTADSLILFRSGLWMSTNAISSISLSVGPYGTNINANSTFALYGIKGA